MSEIAAPPPAPAETTAPPVQAAPPIAQSFDQSFPDDGLDTPPAPPPPKAPAETKEEKSETKETEKGTKVTQAETPAPKTEIPKAEAPTDLPKGDFSPPQVAKPSELRNWANRMGSRAQKAEGEIQKLHSRIAQLEQQPRQPEGAANMAQELAAAKKRIEQYETDLRLTKYERSQEYADKFQKPYQDSIARAYRQVKQLLVNEPNPDDPDNPRERMATEADFNQIYALDDGQAIKLAKAKFGDAYLIVLQHRERIRELAEAAYTAVEEYKAKGTQAETQSKAQHEQNQAAMQQMFHTATEGHAKRTPELFMERDGDSEGNALLAKGKEFASAVFSGNEGLTPQQVAFRDAMAFNRLSAYPRLVRDIKKIKADLEEANKTIESLRGSGPGKIETGKHKPDASGYKPFEQAFDEAVPG